MTATLERVKNKLLSIDDFNFENIEEDELKKKLKDPRWRISHLYKILDEDFKVVTFKPNLFQRFLLQHLHWRVIIAKARQLGMSTFIEIFILDQCLFHKNTSAAIVADKKENAKKLLGKVLFAWDHFPEPLKEHLGLVSASDSKTEITWTNGSSVFAGTTIHSGTHRLLHLSELGPLCSDSAEKAAEVVQSAIPTVPDIPNTFVFIESTARNEGDLFHVRCLDAMAATKQARLKYPDNPSKGLSILEYRFFFFPWWKASKNELGKAEAETVELPRVFKKYFERMERNLGKTFSQQKRAWYVLKSRALKEKFDETDITRRMRSEYPSYAAEAFLSGGSKLFDSDIINEKIRAEAAVPIEETDDHMRTGAKWKIYKHFHKNHRYGIGADTSMGVGGHHSTAVVVDFTTREIVATYKCNTIQPDDFGRELARAGRWYGTCIIAPEMNYGGTTIGALSEEYENIYRYHIMSGDEPKETERLGWLTNVNTKSTALFGLATAFQDDESPFTCPDPAILYEALYYDKEDILVPNTVKQAKGMTNHFDLLMAAAIAVQMDAYAEQSGEMEEQEITQTVMTRRNRKRGCR